MGVGLEFRVLGLGRSASNKTETEPEGEILVYYCPFKRCMWGYMWVWGMEARELTSRDEDVNWVGEGFKDSGN